MNHISKRIYFSGLYLGRQRKSCFCNIGEIMCICCLYASKYLTTFVRCTFTDGLRWCVYARVFIFACLCIHIYIYIYLHLAEFSMTAVYLSCQSWVYYIESAVTFFNDQTSLPCHSDRAYRKEHTGVCVSVCVLVRLGLRAYSRHATVVRSYRVWSLCFVCVQFKWRQLTLVLG